jgi:hypothetical protein
MRLFDFVFVGAAFVSLFVVISIIVEAFRRRFSSALRLAAGFSVAATVYLGIIVAVSLFEPQEVLRLRQERCFDDWCIAVENVSRTEAENVRLYTVSYRMASRARRVTQRENGVSTYIVDQNGKRFDPLSDQAALPFDTYLKPGESAITVRTFALQGVSGPVQLVLAHEGLYRFPGLFVIADESSLFHKPIIVPLPE